jgi:hypothetical protein
MSILVARDPAVGEIQRGDDIERARVDAIRHPR